MTPWCLWIFPRFAFQKSKNIRNSLIFLWKMAAFSCLAGPKVMIFHTSMKIMTFGPWHHYIFYYKKIFLKLQWIILYEKWINCYFFILRKCFTWNIFFSKIYKDYYLFYHSRCNLLLFILINLWIELFK